MKLGYCKKQPLKQLSFKKTILPNLLRTSVTCLKDAFAKTFGDRGQRHITLVKHLNWHSFAKILQAVNYFHKRFILDV